MPRIFKEITGSVELIPAVTNRHIEITHVWIKIANGWTAGNLFALQFDNSTDLMFPRDAAGVEHEHNSRTRSRLGESLRAYYRVASGESIYLDITYNYTV